MGTSLNFHFVPFVKQDHPHAYGDKIKKICSELKLDLSSPRVWGQDLIAITAQRVFRIIPTRMGTRKGRRIRKWQR